MPGVRGAVLTLLLFCFPATAAERAAASTDGLSATAFKLTVVNRASPHAELSLAHVVRTQPRTAVLAARDVRLVDTESGTSCPPPDPLFRDGFEPDQP